MKNILITGSNSYIGNSVENYLRKDELKGRYQVDVLDMKNQEWRTKIFNGYDTVFHVAGIAHVDIRKATQKEKELYYRINCDLTLETARKAKEEGVKQFIFMSSLIVYGNVTSVRKAYVVTKDTKPAPVNFYGASKRKAEVELLHLSNKDFRIAILRPPMIYGEGCKGNYRVLEKLALKLPVFPDYPNKRSVVSIKNFCIFLQALIDAGNGGIYFPQDPEYTSTSEMVKRIAESHGKRIILIPYLNWLIYILSKVPGEIGKMTNKAFGSLIYEKNINDSKP